MNQNVSLERKIIGLILLERGLPIESPVVASLLCESSLTEQISQLIKSVETLASDTGSKNEIIIEQSAPEAESEEKPRPELWKLMPYYEFAKPAETEITQPAPEQLKPGHVPVESQHVRKPLPPQAKITIQNARAGEPFFSAMTIALDDMQQGQINEVIFPQDIGLTYAKDQQAIIGTPTESGDFTLTILWSCGSHCDCETKQLFVVNPDPRSLWKIVEPPANAPYQKSHVDSAGLFRDNVRIAAASRRGRSHEHAGSFRDDDFYINHSDKTEWSVMLVADGAGSAKNSREGSRIAVRTAGDYLFSQLDGQRGEALKDLILTWGASEQQTTINAMLHHFKQAATLAVNSIQNEAICADQPIKTYSTTLLAVISIRLGGERFAASFWLGDGAIAAYSPSGKVRVLGNPDSGEYAGQTRFLDQSVITDTAFTGRISIGKWNDVSHLILMTDGVSDPRFETDNGLRHDGKWTNLVNELSPILEDADQAPSGLAEWLNFFSPGNHDDRTIVVLW